MHSNVTKLQAWLYAWLRAWVHVHGYGYVHGRMCMAMCMAMATGMAACACTWLRLRLQGYEAMRLLGLPIWTETRPSVWMDGLEVRVQVQVQIEERGRNQRFQVERGDLLI